MTPVVAASRPKAATLWEREPDHSRPAAGSLRREIDIPTLRRLIALDTNTGKIFWRPRSDELFAEGPRQRRHCRAWNAQFCGKEALIGRAKDGYLRGIIHLRGIAYRFLAHRVVYAIHSGDWPRGQIDHINGDRQDNRPANLRDIPGHLNQQNMSRARNNTSGVTGVCRCLRGAPWQAYINVDSKRISLGRFGCFDDAVAARKAAEAMYGFHPNHGRSGGNVWLKGYTGAPTVHWLRRDA